MPFVHVCGHRMVHFLCTSGNRELQSSCTARTRPLTDHMQQSTVSDALLSSLILPSLVELCPLNSGVIISKPCSEFGKDLPNVVFL